MKCSTSAVILLGGLALLTPTLCRAQSSTNAADTTTAKPLTLKLGIFLPTNSDIKTELNSTWFDAGLEYALHSKDNAAIAPNLYLDGAVASNSYDDGQGNTLTLSLTSVGLGVGVKSFVGGTGSGSVQPYVGAGVGIYSNSAKLDVSLSDGSTGTASHDETAFGYKLQAGLLFAQRYSIEYAYVNPGKIYGLNLAGSSITFGFKL